MNTTTTPFDKNIAPDIVNDELSHALFELASRPDVHTILEIGAGSGDGSTASFVAGLLKNPNKGKRFLTIEFSRTRADMVEAKHGHHEFVYVHNGCSVLIDEYVSEQNIRDFYNSQKSALNDHPLHTVLQWRQNELDYITAREVPQDVINTIKSNHNINDFDLVLIDGSEFTGDAELERVMGAKFIVLDDVNAMKNMNTHLKLGMPDVPYRMVQHNYSLRNGYSIWQRI